MSAIPYKIAVLVYVFNEAGQLLLLRRSRPPNQDRFSPIGGKLEQHLGESPYACALREIEEEISIRLTLADIRLLGIVSERAFPGSSGGDQSGGGAAGAPVHWLMFCFEVTLPLNFPARAIDEGQLEWHAPDSVPTLNIPQTDSQVIWPLVRQHSAMLHRNSSVGAAHINDVFSVFIDCTDHDNFVVTHEHPRR